MGPGKARRETVVGGVRDKEPGGRVGDEGPRVAVEMAGELAAEQSKCDTEHRRCSDTLI